MIRKKALNYFLYEKHCNRCEKGFYQSTGIQFSSNPPKYEHKCNLCGAGFISGKCYPYVGYELDKDKPIEWINQNA